VVDSPVGSRAIGGIEVVDDHDGMMSLMKRLSGQEQSSHDYEKEEGHGHDHAEHGHETCNECGMYECECPSDKEMVDEVESEDQMTYKVAEDGEPQNPPDNGSANSTNDEQGNAAANQALATADAEQNADTKQVNVSEEEEECPTCHHKKCECDEEKVEGQELRLCDDYSKIIAQASREEVLVLQVREAKRTLSEMLRGAFLTAVQMLLAANFATLKVSARGFCPVISQH
jgi:hypothetical protein